jgi:hypothetical protein
MMPESICSSPAIALSSVLLPQPEGAHQHGKLASGNFEVYTAHGMNAAITLVQVRDLQIGHGLALVIP